MPELITADLSAWAENTVPATLVTLLVEYGLRPGDVDMAEGFASVQEALKTGGDEADKAFLKLLRLRLLVLNLMRDQCKLGFTDAPVQNWDEKELVAPPWGNDFETSDNPKNSNGERGTVSPRPGWFYRMVQTNAEIVCRQLRYWEPDGVVKPERIAQIEAGPKRKRALDLWARINQIPKGDLNPAPAKGRRKTAA